MTEVALAVWYHQLNGYEFQQTPRDSEGQGSLECFSSWGHKQLDTTEQLDNYALILQSISGTVILAQLLVQHPWSLF